MPKRAIAPAVALLVALPAVAQACGELPLGMTVRGTVVTRPSDATGERPIGDAILVTGGAS